MLFFFWLVVIDAPTDGEGGLEDENRSVSGFLHFDTTTKGKAFWIHDKFIYIYNKLLKISRNDYYAHVFKFLTGIEKQYKGLLSKMCYK